MRSFSPLDLLVLLLCYAILLIGITQQANNSDATKYQCYAQAFWHGNQGLQVLPPAQCAFITHPTNTAPALSQSILIDGMRHYGLPVGSIQFVAAQSPTAPYHALPYEYPLLAVLSFSVALLTPLAWYQITFAALMIGIATGLYALLIRTRSRQTALTYSIYLAMGCFVTALGRFDLLPTACTFGALLCAERLKWNWAFFLLALATMLKFYPVVLLIPLLIAQQRLYEKEAWYAWPRFVSLGIFVLTCTSIVVVSLLVNVTGTIAPLTYFGQRPLQIEAVSASLVWLISMLSGFPLHYAFSFGSRNVFSPLTPVIMQCSTILLIVGLCYIYWLQWRQKITLALAFLLTLLIVIITGKVFSAQYLLWVVPFVAYVGGWNRKWFIAWSSISLMTTLIYPFLYNRGTYPFGSLLPDFYATIFVRNALLLLFTTLILYRATRNHFRTST